MNTVLTSRAARQLVLAAALGLAAAAAPAADRFDSARTPLVKPGMTQDEVQQVLGQPAHSQYYFLSQSTTWTYEVDPVSAEQVIFDVDFDAQGRVAASGERRLPTP